MSNKSTTQLTAAQKEFYSKILTRATSPLYDTATKKPVGQPFLSSILYSLIVVNAPDIETMGVDKYGRLYINFDNFMDPNGRLGYIDGATKALNHEPWHLLYKHMQRFEALPDFDPETRHRKNHQVWNYAGDLTINQGIRPLVPDWALHVGEEGRFKDYPFNLSAEEYYQRIKNEENVCPDCWQPLDDESDTKPENGDQADADDKSDKSDDAGQPGNGDKPEGDTSGNSSDDTASGEDASSGKSGPGSDGDGSGSAEGGSEPGESSAGNGQAQNGQDSGQGQDSHGHNCGSCGKPIDVQCGSGAGGEPGDWELDGDEAPKLADYQLDDLRRATAEEMRRFANGNPGRVPGNLLVWAEDTLKAPLPDWKKVLRATFNRAVSWTRGKMDYSFTRPNRRNQNPKIVLPSLRAPVLKLAYAVDTSGSNLHNMGIVVDNCEAISRQSGARGRDLLAFSVDVVADEVKPVNSPRAVLDNTRGGGGTDMRVAFKVFEKLNRQGKADIGILITDLETPWPAKPPKVDMRFIVVGVLNSNDMNSHYVKEAKKALKPWADLVLITPEQVEEQA